MASRLRRDGSPVMSFFAFQDIITAAAGIMILITLIMALDLGEAPSAPSVDPVQQDPKLQPELTRLLNQLALAGGTNGQLRGQWAEMQKRPNPKEMKSEIERLTGKISQAREEMKRDEDKVRVAAAAMKEEDSRLGLDGLRRQLNQAQNTMAELSNKVAAAKQRTAALEQQTRQIRSQLLVIKSREGQLWLVPDPNASTKEPILVVVSGKGLTLERFDRPNERITLAAKATGEFKARLKQYNKLNQYFVFYIRPSGINLFDEANADAKAAGFDTGFEPVAEAQLIHFSKPKEPEVEVPPIPASGSSEAPKTGSPPPVDRPEPPSAPPVATPPPVTTVPPTPPPSLWQRIKNFIGLS